MENDTRAISRVTTNRSNFRTVECLYWQKGRCPKGNQCTFKHSGTTHRAVPRNAPANAVDRTLDPTVVQPHPAHKRRVCEHYLAKVWCKFGENCKFSHESPGEAGRTESGVEERPGALLFTLKGILRSFCRDGEFRSLLRFQEFLDVALKVLDSKDREIQSEAVVALSAEGHRLIAHVVEQVGGIQHPIYTNPLRDLNYHIHVIPFIKLLVHDAFSRSCVEKSFMHVVKAIYGPDGQRASNFLERLVQHLENERLVCGGNQELQTRLHDGCFLVCRVLHYTVRYNTEAVGQSTLMDLHARLKEISTGVQTPFSARMDRFLAETAAYLIPIKINPMAEPKSSSTDRSLTVRFHQRQLLVDLPGDLSSSYPRHDNDSSSIAKIHILPTKGEMLCDRDPYIPINDVATHHFFNGPSRLFDIHFRLLREDMIGPLRNAVTSILRDLQQNPHGFSRQVAQRHPNMASTRLYFDVTVETARFDKKCGLKFQLQFRQPKAWTRDQRKSYWEGTKSLDKGSLLCLISNTPDFICFVTVVEKQLNLLVEDPGWARIDVTPEGQLDNYESLLKYIRNKCRKASLALVEFPGVLLIAYKAILASLQARSIHPFLPFSNLLCPTPNERQPYDPSSPHIQVRPPLYASTEGFSYDLTPLKHQNSSREPLILSPSSSPDDRELILRLERETTLDFGQCKGLIAALTREMGLVQGKDYTYFQLLIQGPPGTGKTYLGVEIVKVLLHNKSALGLKPIICV